MPVVSIIIPVFNGATFLSEALTSVQGQTFQDFEVIVIDDASTDNSLEIINSFCCMDSRFMCISLEKNVGGGAARNVGLMAASARYVAFLDSDDFWFPKKLSIQLKMLESNDNVALVCSAFLSLFEDGFLKEINPPSSIDANRLRYTNDICCSSVLVDRKRAGDLRFPDIRYRQDWGLWLSILQSRPIALCIDTPLLVYRNYGGISSKKSRVFIKQWEFFREHCGYGLLQSCGYFVLYTLFGFSKATRHFAKRGKL